MSEATCHYVGKSEGVDARKILLDQGKRKQALHWNGTSASGMATSGPPGGQLAEHFYPLIRRLELWEVTQLLSGTVRVSEPLCRFGEVRQ